MPAGVICQMLNTKRRMLNAELDAERQILISGISCETCAFGIGRSAVNMVAREIIYISDNCFALLRWSLLWSIITVAILSVMNMRCKVSAMSRIQMMMMATSKLFIFQNQKSQ